MLIIKAETEILQATPDLEKLIELAGRVCWKSEDRITEGSSDKFIEMLKSKNHVSVLEHGAITVRIICDRGILAELSRHRICSLSVESSRYCSYNKDKFSNQVSFIDPRPGFPDMGNERFRIWKEAMQVAEEVYLFLLERGAKPEEARNVLPNSLKTEIVITANPREWLHIFEVRTSSGAHPQMKEIMIPLKNKFIERWPSLFNPV